MSVAVSKFITDIAMHYPKKHESPAAEKAWLQSMVNHLRGYSPAILERAAQDILDNRTDRFFPLPSECKEACNNAKEALENISRAKTLPTLRQGVSDDWSTERVRLAYDLVKSSMGRQAAKDNPCWVLALWHFCRRNQRLPAGNEIDQCKRDAREFDEAYRDALRGEAVDRDGVMRELPNGRALQKLGASMLAKREKLCAEVLGR